MLDQSREWCPIFITYDKSDEFSETTKYEDRFIDQETIMYYSKNRRTLSSPDVSYFMDCGRHSIRSRIPMFIKKNDDEGIEFYYIGDAVPSPSSFKQSSMDDGSGGMVSVVSMIMKIDRPVEHHLYEYIVSDTNSRLAQRS